ncbi:MAG: tRNA (uridine(34)/cytosine(34)/5-carboxymethylaminomethyluridine(34)-2'-O)-methyltransferase TrmL [Gammaproteobacteria bacterium]|nr:MAG: tRNA (uridine(34)/cytosine(34)/5-carboxymethylaminomethyluridine(34)-2'-O)-methyltransferase TrmL [Gammaproteobacteria bacterium]
MNVVLYHPQIPPNTGNIIRLCANIPAYLHLIKPYGFLLDHKNVRRAGLDYHDLTQIKEHESWDEFLQSVDKEVNIYTVSTKGKTIYTQPDFQDSDYFIFGSEISGLPKKIREGFKSLVIPMRAGSRSINLSNSVAIVLYEVKRQLSFY